MRERMRENERGRERETEAHLVQNALKPLICLPEISHK